MTKRMGRGKWETASGQGTAEMRRSGMLVLRKPGAEGVRVREAAMGPRLGVLRCVWAVGVEARPVCRQAQSAIGKQGTERQETEPFLRPGERSRGQARRCEGRRVARLPAVVSGVVAGVVSGVVSGVVPGVVAAAEPGEELAFYRKYTEALLRRYQRLQLQAGRVPSPMDREIFRGRMSHYKVHGFDDAVIFCADVEKCMGRLNGEDQRLLRRIAVQEYTMGEAAGVLRMSLRRCIVLYRRALDRMTRIFLELRLLEPEKSLSRAGGGLE